MPGSITSMVLVFMMVVCSTFTDLLVVPVPNWNGLSAPMDNVKIGTDLSSFVPSQMNVRVRVLVHID